VGFMFEMVITVHPIRFEIVCVTGCIFIFIFIFIYEVDK
jgi:hypothetical protein